MPDHSAYWSCEQCYYHQRSAQLWFDSHTGSSGEWKCGCGWIRSDAELDARAVPWWQYPPTGVWYPAWHPGLPEGPNNF